MRVPGIPIVEGRPCTCVEFRPQGQGDVSSGAPTAGFAVRDEFVASPSHRPSGGRDRADEASSISPRFGFRVGDRWDPVDVLRHGVLVKSCRGSTRGGNESRVGIRGAAALNHVARNLQDVGLFAGRGFFDTGVRVKFDAAHDAGESFSADAMAKFEAQRPVSARLIGHVGVQPHQTRGGANAEPGKTPPHLGGDMSRAASMDGVGAVEPEEHPIRTRRFGLKGSSMENRKPPNRARHVCPLNSEDRLMTVRLFLRV